MTETNVVEITIVDDSNYEKNYRLDNPKDDITLSKIRSAFATPIQEGWLLGKSGGPVVAIARAQLIVTTKTAVE